MLHSYIEKIQAFAETFEYPTEATEEIWNTFEKVFSKLQNVKDLDICLQAYETDCEKGFFELLALCARVAEEMQVNVYTLYMAALMLFAEVARKHYEKQGFSKELWKNNFMDLTYKLQECKLVKGVWGTFVPDWFHRFYNVSRFAFGKLQFESITFGRVYEKNGVKLTEDSVVINMHIPRTGKGLFPQDVEDSCEAADRFYKEKLGLKQVVFVCHSWLLYPANKELLKPTSNLYSFISRFDLIEVEDSQDYHEVWRLFDKEYTGDPSLLPADTSFRRGYIEKMRKGEKTGAAYGVFVYKPKY